jgi:hypothetical protein
LKSCAEAVTPGSMGDVCPGTASEMLYNALADCSCAKDAAMMGCKDVCGDNLCMGMDPSTDCGKCVQTGNCTAEFGACSGDI